MVPSPSLIGLIPAIRLVALGITCYMAVQTLIFVYYEHHRHLNSYFLLLCIIVAFQLLVETQYYQTTSPVTAARLLQWHFALILAFMPALFGFVAIYTGQQYFKTWLLSLSLICGTLIIINFLVTPYSLRFSTLQAAAPVELPWGESMIRYTGSPSGWNVLGRALFTALFIWAFVRAKMLFQRGSHRSALFLAGALGFMFIASYVGLLVDLGYIHFVIPGGLSFFGLIVFMSVGLALEMRDNNIAMKKTTEDLQKEIVLHKEAQEKIRHMAYHNHVTGLPNRVRLHELLSDASTNQAKAGRKGALILLNLDDFKAINDVFGHNFGDHLLQLVAKRLQTLRQEDSMLAHMDSDEFAILMPDIGRNSEEAAAVAKRIAKRNIDSLLHPFCFEDRCLEITASAGIALFPEDEENESMLLQRVDMALHRAKFFGRGTIELYADEMKSELYERIRLEREMRQGIERGEFLVHFQPQMDFSGKVVGAEALLRWNHPERGLISPALFVPIAERSGLISRLGDWVLQQSCEQIKSWEESFPLFKGHLSVNVSVWQFKQSNYKESVCHQLVASGISGERLTLEITEGVFIDDIEGAISTMNFLRSRGLRFSIDDFGTGYAALSYLRRLPVDELKIDQSFIRNFGTDLRDTHLVETIINIGKCMGLQVVAEGVENELQRAALMKMNCWALQGYYLAPPMDKEAFFNWLKQQYESVQIAVAK